MKDYTVTMLLAVILTTVMLTTVNSCNEAVCAAVVSKCMLTESCNCDLKNSSCPCCKDCFMCLGEFYDECCSCVDMCPKPNDKADSLSTQSYVEDFEDPIPGLFKVLTAEPDPDVRWLIITFPVDIDLSAYQLRLNQEIKMLSEDNEEVAPSRKDVVTLNCTVAYFSSCMSRRKCKRSCESTGASKYRWFHDGCCECIGDSCITYGINKSRCLLCSPHVEDSIEDKDDYFYDDDIDYEIEEKALKQTGT